MRLGGPTIGKQIIQIQHQGVTWWFDIRNYASLFQFNRRKQNNDVKNYSE